VFRSLAFVGAVLTLANSPATAQRATEFSRLVERLSEPGGSFHSDNLVSNETSYLHVLEDFRAIPLKGGAYLGVGPEQGFSYIAELEPEIALMVDIRRDNLLLHLLLKAMFERAHNRLEYLCFLYGRRPPSDLASWTDLPLESLLQYVDRAGPDSALHRRDHQRLMKQVTDYGVGLSPEDRTTLARFHDEFVTSGLDIQYTTRAGPVWRQMPPNRDLYLATDLDHHQASYLSSEDRWRRVRALERKNRVVPIVADLSGTQAMAAVARYLRETGLLVSAFYVSNVEQYLFRQGSFASFVANVRALPFNPNGVLVRSVIGGPAWAGPSQSGTLASRQRAQPIARFLELTSNPDSVEYWTLINDTTGVRSEGAPPRGIR
jgi:hypothetical protein